jgi:heterodisulfide reductase subunit D
MYSEILEESISPKGRNALIRAIRQGVASPDDRAVRIAYSCLLCKRDEFSCTPHLKNAEATEIFRRYLVDIGVPLLPEHELLAKSLENYGNPWQEPRMARKRWARELRRHQLRQGETETLFYVGCTYSLDRSLQDAPRALLRLMERFGENFGLLLEEEVCCGSTAKRIGHFRLFEKLRAENEKKLRESGVRTIVTSCAGCYKTLKQDYPGLGKDVEILHSTEFLERRIRASKLEWDTVPLRVTYHDPCHLGRHMEIYEAPRAILRSIPGLELVEMGNSRETSRCCGGGAGVKTAYPEISKAIARKRLKEAEGTGAKIIVTTCPFCAQTLRSAVDSAHPELEVVTLEVLLDRVLKKGGRTG